MNQSTELMTVEAERAIAQVQGSMTIAKRFPRDCNSALMRILESCKRVKLAEVAMYSYPRGGQRITGPSIRLAEAIAQSWGNLDTGIVELERRNGQSIMMAYAMDLELNVRETRTFTVSHIREKRGGNEQLTGERDIYELTANMAARRKRACILAVIPGDIVEEAIGQCEQTLAGAIDGPIEDTVRKLLKAFQPLGINAHMIEERIGHKLDAVIPQEIVNLRKIYQSIKDGFASREDYFPLASDGEEKSKLDDLADALANGSKPEPDPPKPKRKQRRKPKPKPDPTPDPVDKHFLSNDDVPPPAEPDLPDDHIPGVTDQPPTTSVHPLKAKLTAAITQAEEDGVDANSRIESMLKRWKINKLSDLDPETDSLRFEMLIQELS